MCSACSAVSLLQACKVALTRLGPLLGSERISQLFQNNLSESSTLLYGEFLNSFCKLMVRTRHTPWPSAAWGEP